LPFQVWISAPPPLAVSAAFSLMPRATQSFADGQDTPYSWLAGGGALAGLTALSGLTALTGLTALADAAVVGLCPAVAGLATAIEAATPSIAVSATSPEAAIVRMSPPQVITVRYGSTANGHCEMGASAGFHSAGH
jgi:hypothetical protein